MPFQGALRRPKGCSYQALEAGQGVMVDVDGGDALPVGLGLDRLGFNQLEKSSGTQAVTLLSQAELLVGPDLVLVLDQGCLIGRGEGGVTAGEIGFQAKFLVPMGVSIAAGLLFATVLTLVAVPAMYLIVEDFRQGASSLVRWFVGRPSPLPVPPSSDP